MQITSSTSPFLTVVVFTFNSVKTVIETLESVRNQETHNVELIVADDCSTDGTQKLVSEWVATHQAAFARCYTIFNPINQGICQNVKRAYSRATGVWIKPIAGDDLFTPNALGVLVQRARSVDNDVGLIIGRVQTFFEDGSARTFGDVLPPEDELRELEENALGLLGRLVRENTIPAPSVMVRRSSFEASGGIDENFVHLDDWPLSLNMLEAGAKITTVSDILVGYRVHEGSISGKRSAATMNPEFLRDLVKFYTRYQRRFFSTAERIDKFIYVARWKLALGIFRNRPAAYSTTAILHAFSPLQWQRQILVIRNTVLPRKG
jgi:glycosyltransferase involved in cell wall biosynthesis